PMDRQCSGCSWTWTGPASAPASKHTNAAPPSIAVASMAAVRPQLPNCITSSTYAPTRDDRTRCAGRTAALAAQGLLRYQLTRPSRGPAGCEAPTPRPRRGLKPRPEGDRQVGNITKQSCSQDASTSYKDSAG